MEDSECPTLATYDSLYFGWENIFTQSSVTIESSIFCITKRLEEWTSDLTFKVELCYTGCIKVRSSVPALLDLTHSQDKRHHVGYFRRLLDTLMDLTRLFCFLPLTSWQLLRTQSYKEVKEKKKTVINFPYVPLYNSSHLYPFLIKH